VEQPSFDTLLPLKGMPLTPQYIQRGLDVVRAMKSLQIVGVASAEWPAAEFWRRADAGEFGKLPR
jgi:hypothetical protein